MADFFVQMNNKTAAHLTIHARALNGYSRVIPQKNKNPDATWSLFVVRLVDKAGNYVGLEVKAWGSKDAQAATMKAMEAKFKDGLAFTFSSIKNVRAADPRFEFYSVMQVITFETKAGAASLKMVPILASSADDKALPHVIEPKLVFSDLSSLQNGRLIDICAVVQSISPPSKNTDKTPVCEIVLADEHGKCVTLVWWSNAPKLQFDVNDLIGKPACFYSIWATPRDGTGDLKPLSTTDRTLVLQVNSASAQQRGKNLLEQAAKIMVTSSQSITVATAYVSEDHAKGECVETTISNLSLLDNHTIPCEVEALYQIRSASLIVSSRAVGTDDLRVKDKSRLFVPVVLHDATGSIECRMAEKPALALSELETADDVTLAFENGTLNFARAIVRVLRVIADVDGTNYVNFYIVAAVPIIAGPWKVPTLVGTKTGANIVATTLDRLTYTSLSVFAIDCGNGKTTMADHVLLLLKGGSKAASVTQRDNSVVITNFGIVDCGSSKDISTKISATTSAPMSALVAYNLPKTELRLCLVTAAIMAGNTIDTVVIGSIWAPDKFGVSQDETKRLFALEVMSGQSYGNSTASRKRKAELSSQDYTELFTPSPKNAKVALSPCSDDDNKID